MNDMPNWSKEIKDCHPKIQQVYPKMLAYLGLHYPGCNYWVDYTYRSPAFQRSLYAKGRILKDDQWVVIDPHAVVTNDDGTTHRSHHNVYPAQAADIYIVKNGKILWGNDDAELQLYQELGKVWEEYGLVSGATWRFNWKDPDHVQVAYTII